MLNLDTGDKVSTGHREKRIENSMKKRNRVRRKNFTAQGSKGSQGPTGLDNNNNNNSSEVHWLNAPQ